MPAAREEVTAQQNVPPPPFPAALARLPAARHRIFDAFALGRFRLDDNRHRVAGRERAGISGPRTKDRVRLTHSTPRHPTPAPRPPPVQSTIPICHRNDPGTWTRLAAPFLSTAARSLTPPTLSPCQSTGRKRRDTHDDRFRRIASIRRPDTARTQTLGTKPHDRNAPLSTHTLGSFTAPPAWCSIFLAIDKSIAPDNAVAPSLTSRLRLNNRNKCECRLRCIY